MVVMPATATLGLLEGAGHLVFRNPARRPVRIERAVDRIGLALGGAGLFEIGLHLGLDTLPSSSVSIALKRLCTGSVEPDAVAPVPLDAVPSAPWICIKVARIWSLSEGWVEPVRELSGAAPLAGVAPDDAAVDAPDESLAVLGVGAICENRDMRRCAA